jgi:branched-subunit amino acid ABC-type transport system permease component
VEFFLVLNFAHASFYMLGAYFAYQTGLYIGFWPALFLAPILVGILGAVTERYGLRTVHTTVFPSRSISRCSLCLPHSIRLTARS